MCCKRVCREMAVGNTFGATVLSSYGCFWLGFAVILDPRYQISDAYPDKAELNHGIGFMLLVSIIH